MIDRVQAYVEKYRMIEPGDSVVAGVSGGADSVCLLHLLKELSAVIPMNILAVHVNHGIRAEASADAAYVEQLCKEWEIPFFLIEKDVRAIAGQNHLSEEEAGRNVRYTAFYQIMKEHGGEHAKIAVAHNQNDRAETMLFHLFRGTGIKGLSGIPPVRDVIIRPLLCLERAEIEAYLQEKNISFCIDRTNEEDTYTRNRIRHHILNYAEENICENTVSHLKETAELLEETQRYVEKMTMRAVSVCVQEVWEETLQYRIKDAPFFEQDSLIQKYVLLYCIGKLHSGLKNITSKHVTDVMRLFTKQVNKQLDLPYGILAVREYSGITLKKRKPYQPYQYETGKVQEFNIPVPVPGSLFVAEHGNVYAHLLIADEKARIPEKTYTKWFDYDKIEKSLVLRTRQIGDYITVGAQGERQTVKAYMINQKIPRQERDRILLLADGNHILWILGYRISQHYKVTDETKTILQIQIRGGFQNG